MNSTVLDSHQSSQLSTDLGWALMRSFIQAATFTLIYGIFVLLFLQSARVYFSRKQPSKSQHWMFAVTATTFLLATVHEAVTLLELSLFIRSAFVEDQESSVLIRYYRTANLTSKPITAMSWFRIFHSFISDGVVVWRAYVLSQHKRWLIILSGFLLLVSVTLVLPFLLALAMGKMIVWEAAPALIGVSLSLATNVVATALIGNVYWTHRKELSLGLGAHRTTPAERVLALLTESGVVFCVMQTATLVIVYTSVPKPGTPHFYIVAIITTMYYGLAAIYPTAVIVLVNSHRTFDQICSLNTLPQSRSHGMDRGVAAAPQDIVFAHPPTTNTTDNHEQLMSADRGAT